MRKLSFLLVAACALVSATLSAAPMDSIEWRVPKYSLTARSMSIREAIEGFAVAQGVAILMSDQVQGTLSGDFVDIPSGDFIKRLITMYNLVEYYDGATVWLYGATENVTTMQDLKYMKAGEVADMLKELGVEDPRFPLKTASNDELIMVSGPQRYVQLVIEMIARADKLREMRTFNEVETRIFPLSHTWADDVNFTTTDSRENSMTISGVATLLTELMNGQQNAKAREGNTNDVNTAEAKAAEAASSAFQPVIKADNRLNAVIVRDVATRMKMYEDLINQLDVPQKLVEIGVTTLELTREDSLEWQLSLKVEGASDSKHFSGAAGQNAANLFDEAALAGQGLAGAFTYLGKNVDVTASLSALRKKGKARNLSRTSLLTINNMEATMSDTQSYHAKVVGTEVASLEEVSAGTKLSVKPRSVPSAYTNTVGHVWLTMELEDGGFESVTVDDMPMTRSTTIETQAAVFEGDSILLAGYFRDVQEEDAWGIPYLRDIPLIGWLFGGVAHVNDTYQRMFILTPHTIDLIEYLSPTNTLVQTQIIQQRDVSSVEEVEENVRLHDKERAKREQERKERIEAEKKAEEEKSIIAE